MNEYELTTRKKDGERYTVSVIEDVLKHIWFVYHANKWCYAFLNKDTKCFVLRSGNRWIKRPILKMIFIRKTHNRLGYTPRYYSFIDRYFPISRQLRVAMRREDMLFDYLTDLIKENNLPFIVLGNGISGKDQKLKGDLLIHKLNKEGKMERPVTATIEHLSIIGTSVRLDQKDILQDQSKVKAIDKSIHYVIAYLKCNDKEEHKLYYGFVDVNKKTKHLFRDKTSISLTKLRDYEIDITDFLKQM